MKIATPNKHHIYEVTGISCDDSFIENGFILIEQNGIPNFRLWDYDKCGFYIKLENGVVEQVEYSDSKVAERVMELAIDYFTNNPDGVFVLPTQNEIAEIIAKENN